MSQGRWMAKLEVRIGAFAVARHARPGRALLLAGLLTLVAGAFVMRLSLDADLTALLPASMPSVQDIEKLKERFGGIGYVVVVGRDAEPEALVRFADDAAQRLAKVEGIRYVDARREDAFFREHALYYLSVDDLREVERRLDDRIRWERRRRNPMYVQLEDDAAPAVDFADLQAKYGSSSSSRLAGGGRSHYLDGTERLVVVLAKPMGNSVDLGYSQALLERVEASLADLDPRAYGPDFRIEQAGTFQKKLDQQRQITRDVATASTLALLLLLAYLLLHFRSVVAIVLNLVPVGLGLAWTYGGVGAAYGEVNLLTGFLGAILGGLGVEHGIHLLGRYQSLRADGRSSEEATREAFAHTGASAILSALVAALTFLALAVSEFRAFREFGVIAAVGMIVVIAAYLLILPALLGVAARLGWRQRATAISARRSPLARWIPSSRIPLAAGLVVFAIIAVAALPRVRFDYDFGALEDSNLPSFVLDRKVNAILGYSQTPAVVLTSSPGDEAAVVAELERRRVENGPRSTIDFVAGLDQLVPSEQEAKREVLASLGALAQKIDPDRLEPEWREALETLRTATRAAPFTRADLPEAIRRQFTGAAGTDDSGFVLVFPRVRLSDGTAVRAFASEVSDLPVPGGRSLSAAGEAMILADILELVTTEAPRILLAALVSVLLAMWITLGSLREALLCMTPTLVSILGLVGLMPVVGERFNYLNILVVPVLIGVTIDASVHLVSRLRAERDFDRAYTETARAIVGGLITSAVGFSALLVADHPGLNSIGRLANLGFAVNLLVTLLGFPALFLLVNRWRPALAHPAGATTPDPVERPAT